MFGNLRLQCRQYGGAIRYFRKMVRLLLQYLICNKSFFILPEIAILCSVIFVTIRKNSRNTYKAKGGGRYWI